jgi:outer membrane protein assembly factor BamB
VGGPAVDDSYAYFGNSVGQFRKTPKTNLHNVLGAFSTDGHDVYGAAAIGGEVVYITNGYILCAVQQWHKDAAKTTPLWSDNVNRPHHPILSSPAVVGGVVYVGSEVGTVLALAHVPNTPEGLEEATLLLWSQPGSSVHDWQGLASGIESSPAVANGVVYVGSNDHNLYALDASSGEKLRAINFGLPVKSSPAVVDGVVYVGAGDPKNPSQGGAIVACSLNGN